MIATILNITYGYCVADEDDSYVALADDALRTSSQASVFGTYLVDYIPMLKYVPSWMPGASFKRKAREWRRLTREMLESQFRIVKQNMVSGFTIYIHKRSKNLLQARGTAVSCIATRELESWMESDRSASEEELIMNTTANAYAGTSECVTDRKALLMSKFDSRGRHRK